MAVSKINKEFVRKDLTESTDASGNCWLPEMLPQVVVAACSEQGYKLTPFLAGNGHWYVKSEATSTRMNIHYLVI